jgi:hypothetical protein
MMLVFFVLVAFAVALLCMVVFTHPLLDFFF